MSIPPIPKLEEAAKKIVWGAQKEGSLRDFTPRIIRQTIEKEFSLDDGTLDAPEYKQAIKAATKAALDEKPPAPDGLKMEGNDDENLEDIKTKRSPKRKRKSDGPVTSEVLDNEREEEEESAPTSKAKGKAKAKKAAGDDEDDNEDGSAKKKRKTVSRKPKAKAVSDDENHEEETPNKKRKTVSRKPKAKVLSDDENHEENPNKKQKTAGRKPKKSEDDEDEEVVKPTAKRNRARKDTKEFKSLEHVPTSDMEQDDPDPISVAGPSSLQSSKPTESTKKQKPTSPAQRKSTQKNDTTPRKPVSAAKPKLKEVIKSKDVEMDDAAVKSESELSVLVDEPPKRKRKSSSGEKKPPKPKEKKGKTSATLSKDEETIKRLKSLVVACGTRKVWSKVFQDLDTPQQQIKKLKEMLTELGMTGRMSMEQAKAIKEKRELAQELQDVVEFASKVAGRTSRSQKASSDGHPSKGDDESEKGQESGSEEEEDVGPKRSTTARKSIMAFLEDQSDDE